ncbi:MAG: lipid II flippase MurJ, partial [Lentisphaeria bacterium]|nr:lipid II flippase MurJ [Lentisphaeria bacterium]
LAKVASNPFHARKDTKTPVQIALLCMCLNLVLNLLLMRFLSQGGLALSTSVCSWLNVILLLKLNQKRQKSWQARHILIALLSLTVLAAAAGAVTWSMRGFLLTRTILGIRPELALHGMLLLLISGTAGALCYLALNMLARRPELKELMQAVGLK